MWKSPGKNNLSEITVFYISREIIKRLLQKLYITILARSLEEIQSNYFSF